MLRSSHSEGLHTHQHCKDFIGKMFRVKFYECPTWWTDSEVADFILDKTVLIHLTSPRDKFNMLVFMTKKLFSFAQDKCKVEGADAVMMQELLLGKTNIKVFIVHLERKTKIILNQQDGNQELCVWLVRELISLWISYNVSFNLTLIYGTYKMKIKASDSD